MSWTDPRRYLRLVRAAVVLVVGSTVVLLGVVMIFTPGPAVIVIPLGIAILATEFAWARRLLDRTKAEILDRVRRRRGRSPAGPPAPEPTVTPEPPPDSTP